MQTRSYPHPLWSPEKLALKILETSFRVNGGVFTFHGCRNSEPKKIFSDRLKDTEWTNFHSVDIDHQIDLEYANMLLEKKYINDII